MHTDIFQSEHKNNKDSKSGRNPPGVLDVQVAPPPESKKENKC